MPTGRTAFGKMFSVKIKGDDLKGLRVDVKLKPRIPQDEVARANRARLLKGRSATFTSKTKFWSCRIPLQIPLASE